MCQTLLGLPSAQMEAAAMTAIHMQTLQDCLTAKLSHDAALASEGSRPTYPVPMQSREGSPMPNPASRCRGLSVIA